MVDRLRAERRRLDATRRGQKRQRGSDVGDRQTKSTTGTREVGRVRSVTGDRHTNILTHAHDSMPSGR